MPPSSQANPPPGQIKGVSKLLITAVASAVIKRYEFAELGRYRHGDWLTLNISLTSIPDSAPIAVVFNSASQVVGSYPLASVDSTNRNFSIPIQVSLTFPFGTYLVSYQFAVSGVQGSIQGAQFQVLPGGNAGGDVIFLHALDRPEATFVLAQLSSGRLCVGRNPYIGD